MAFKKRQIKEVYLSNTSIENIFINEYMVAAPGEYVKVYLLSFMYAELGEDISNEGLAKQLSMDEEDVLKAWTYWESFGAVKKRYIDPKNKFHYDIEFLSLKELLYGSKIRRSKASLDNEINQHLNDKKIQTMYRQIERITGRLLGGKEPTEIMSWLTDFGVTPEVVVYAYSYCVKNRKKDNHKYVAAVIREWKEKNLTDLSAIDDYLQENDKRHFLYKRVLKALGFTRNATEQEKRHMDSWFDEMEFSIEKVLEACSKTSGISNPNINYVNKILKNWYSEQNGTSSPKEATRPLVSMATVQRYYDMIRREAEDEAGRRTAEVYETIPEIKEIDEQLRDCGMEISRMMISGNIDKKKQINKYKMKVDNLSAQKISLLKEKNLDEDYLEPHYRCEVCRDSGTDDSGERCSCFQEILKEAEIWNKTSKK